MSESGCLKTEIYSSMNINDRIISKSFNGGRLEIKSKPRVSLEDFSKEVKDIPDDTDSEYIIHDGAFLTLTNNKQVDKAISLTGTDSFETPINIDWPKGSYIQDVSIVFKNTETASAIDFGTNTIHIKLEAVDDIPATPVVKGTIMDYKKIGIEVGEGVGKVFKNIPIPIIKYCTGIHSQSLNHSPAFMNQEQIANEEFSIINPETSECWTKGYTSLERCYPLYNPQDVPVLEGSLPNKLRLSLAITTLNGAVGDPSSLPADATLTPLRTQLANTELLVIVTYMKMNLKDIAF